MRIQEAISKELELPPLDQQIPTSDPNFKWPYQSDTSSLSGSSTDLESGKKIKRECNNYIFVEKRENYVTMLINNIIIIKPP